MVAQRIPEPLTAAECESLLSVPSKRYPTGLRNLSMLHVMLNAGLRSSEVLHLLPRDIDLNSGKIFVRQGKGGKDRVLWLNESALEVLRLWRERRPNGEFLFCTLKGKPLNSRYLRTMVARCGQKAKLERRVHPHLLRHTFASDLLRQRKDLRIVQEALGHAWVSTTQIYTHVANTDLEEAMRNFKR